MRQVYLVTYDISDPARLRRVFLLMRRYGDHLQLSAFRCVLNGRERLRLGSSLSDIIHATEDQVLFCSLGPEEGRGEDAITAVGRVYSNPERHAIVV